MFLRIHTHVDFNPKIHFNAYLPPPFQLFHYSLFTPPSTASTKKYEIEFPNLVFRNIMKQYSPFVILRASRNPAYHAHNARTYTAEICISSPYYFVNSFSGFSIL